MSTNELTRKVRKLKELKAMAERLRTMEDRKTTLEDREEELNHVAMITLSPKSTYLKAFRTAKKRLSEGKLERTKEIINQFVEVVTVYKDYITIDFNFDGAEETTIPQKKIPQKPTRQSSVSTVPFDYSINTKIDTMDGRGRRT